MLVGLWCRLPEGSHILLGYLLKPTLPSCKFIGLLWYVWGTTGLPSNNSNVFVLRRPEKGYFLKCRTADEHCITIAIRYILTTSNLPLFWLPSYLLLTVYCYVPSWWSCFPLLPQHGKMLLESSVPVAHEQAKRTVNEGLRTPIGLFLTFLHKSNLKETCIFLLAKKSKR